MNYMDYDMNDCVDNEIDEKMDELRREIQKVNSAINKQTFVISGIQQDINKLEYDLATDGLYTRSHEWKRAIEHEIASLEHSLSYEESLLARLYVKQLRLNAELKPSLRPWEREIPSNQTRLWGSNDTSPQGLIGRLNDTTG